MAQTFTSRSSPWLVAARWAVIALAVFVLLITIIGLFRFADYAARHIDEFTPMDSWTVEQVRAAEAELGWDPMTQVWLQVSRDLFSMFFCYMLFVILIRGRANDWFRLYVALVVILITPNNAMRAAFELFPGLNLFEIVAGAVSWQLFFILFFFFPNGKPTPRWTAWLVAVWVISMPFTITADYVQIQAVAILSYVFVAASVFSQAYRYFRTSNAIERQQTKWLVYLLLFGLVIILIGAATVIQPPDEANLANELLLTYLFLYAFNSIFLLVPVVITISILRYRLWDIDLIIRRTLIYGMLTVMLGLIYFGSVAILQQTVRGITQQESPLVIVISTLLIAALFNPLRIRVQQLIDRRFYRQKYNAEQLVEDFSAHLRAEVNLTDVTQHLLTVTEETLQPECASLWLKKNEALGRKVEKSIS